MLTCSMMRFLSLLLLGLCKCLARSGVGGVGGEWVTGLGLALPILEEHGDSGICVCVLVAVVGEWVDGLSQGLGGCCGVMSVCVVSGLSVLMAGPGICILC